MEDLVKLITTENFSMILAVFLIWFIVKDLKADYRKLHSSIAKQTKAILLLILSQNGSKKRAQEIAKRMLAEPEFDSEEII